MSDLFERPARLNRFEKKNRFETEYFVSYKESRLDLDKTTIHQYIILVRIKSFPDETDGLQSWTS